MSSRDKHKGTNKGSKESGEMPAVRQEFPPSVTNAPGPIIPPSSLPPPSLPLSTIPINSPAPSRTTVSLPGTTFPVTVIGSSSSSPTTTLLQASQTPNSSLSSFTSPAPPSSTNIATFSFQQPSNTTTCGSLHIEWSVAMLSGTDFTNTTIDLAVGSVGSIDKSINILTQWPLLQGTADWSPVTLNPGHYQVVGRWSDDPGNGPPVLSPGFTVNFGANSFCMTGIQAASKSINKGAIAGGTVGGILLLLCAGVATYFLCGLRSRSRTRAVARHSWSGLSTGNSKVSRARDIGESNDYLGLGGSATVAGRDVTGNIGEESEFSMDGEKTALPLTTLPVLEQKAALTKPAVELARIPSRHNGSDTTRSSLEDPFASPPSRRTSRTPRKPVPAYQPTTEELESMAMTRSRSNQSSKRPNVDDGFQPASVSPPSSAGTQNLLHTKSSGLFEGQPVHYLIPDMPMQQRE